MLNCLRKQGIRRMLCNNMRRFGVFSSGVRDLLFDFSIDRGGTFTDIHCLVHSPTTQISDSKVIKLLSVDPNNYKDAPTEGIRRLLKEYMNWEKFEKDEIISSKHIRSIRMGTTVATNALLERKGEPSALLITKGFADLLHIANQSRPNIFDLKVSKPDQLYESVIEVEERIRPKHGTDSKEIERERIGIDGVGYIVEMELNLEKVRIDLEELLNRGISSISVSLLHSYACPQHEESIRELALDLGFKQVSLSSTVMPRIKIVKRGTTASVDAYLNPHIQRYLSSFVCGFDDSLQKCCQLFFMQSDGGLSPLEEFTGSKAILSGPAGGVVGYAKTTETENIDKGIIGFDMGGTSTDVSRYAGGNYEHIFETEIAGTSIQAPQLDITTVAAGGGSRLFFINGLFKVGPESAGANPGPVSYRKGGYLAITDANLVLGRLIPKYFPSIFGEESNLPLDLEGSVRAFEELGEEINEYNDNNNNNNNIILGVEDIAHGFIKVANEAMCRPIRSITEAKGYNPKDHILTVFGGAGGQHACAIAKSLSINKVFIHKYAGVLSAYGMGLADVVQEIEQPSSYIYSPQYLSTINLKFREMEAKNSEKLRNLGFREEQIVHSSDNALMIKSPADSDYKVSFEKEHKREFSFIHDREIIIDNLRVRSEGKNMETAYLEENKLSYKITNRKQPKEEARMKVFFEVNGELKPLETLVFKMEELNGGMRVDGPAIILNETGTILIEPNCEGNVCQDGSIMINVNIEDNVSTTKKEIVLDPIQLSIFQHRFMSISEQMGITLQKTAVSTNIKERLDFSCALFGPDGNLVSNAPHIPVHLGSMQAAIKAQINHLGSDWKEGEVILSNHPEAGGTHLPDMTVITPVFVQGTPVFYVASRGHHADIGGMTPGSMPPGSRRLEEEGVAIYSMRIVENGEFKEAKLREVMAASRNLVDNISDLKAQVAANNKGIHLVTNLIKEYGLEYVQTFMNFIQKNAELSVQNMLRKISRQHNLPPIGRLESEDVMDDGTPICLSITIDREAGNAIFDFEGTGPSVCSNQNAPRAITSSAIIYCLRALLDMDIPLNQGCLNPIQIKIPDGSILSPNIGAAVVGGNVTTSQRITDVILRAFQVCAASQGCMNNLTFGTQKWGYYETIAGGSGAGEHWSGQSGLHTHMTNTRITDPEILESRFPVVLRHFSLRQGSGGSGKWKGGEGLKREIEFLEETEVSMLSERRVFAPYGMKGGGEGAKGCNLIIFPDGTVQNFGGKNSLVVEPGTKIRILTPGGGGYGILPD